MLRHQSKPGKANDYLQKLDDARCNGRWSELGELARKVEKHAPDRKCLATTARSEATVANYSHGTNDGTSKDLIKALVKPLLDASAQTEHAQDAFQARVCVAWAHWMLNEASEAIAALPQDLTAVTTSLAQSRCTQWTQVCIVKSVYIKGFSEEVHVDAKTAQKTYEAVLPFLESINQLSATTSQLHLWAERLVTRMCMLLLESNLDRSAALTQGLRVYRLWDALWNPEPPDIASYKSLTKVDTNYTRRDVWRFCYRFLSLVIQKGLVFFPDATFLVDAAEVDDEQLAEVRLNLRSTLKSVETTCEGLLLHETAFPSASENNEEVDTWADEVVANWRVMCGFSWHDSELGEGGKAALSRGILDILYRAASKTFHSVKILRYLFVVHCSLAEFDLAFKAFDSYTEIVNRSRERTTRTGEIDLGLDSHDTVVRTAAEAIRVLCRYGNFKEAERAYEIGNTITTWLKQPTPAPANDGSTDNVQTSTEVLLKPATLGVAHRAIGIARAHWARMTYDASARAKLQADAITSFRGALSFESEFESLETLYALGLVLAESRDIPGAIKVVKRGLTPSSSSQDSSWHAEDMASSVNSLSAISVRCVRERKQVPLWHLLVLLLTARSEFSMASKACDAAFDQFGSPEILLGPDPEPFKSEHLNEKALSGPRGLVDRMELIEKTRLLQIKITQMSLTEVVEGPSAAMEASSELLALYARLFGDPSVMRVKLPIPSTAVPPKTGATIRASLFSRHRSVKTAASAKEVKRTESNTSSGRPSTTITTTTAAAPVIQVTDESASSENRDSPRPNRPATAQSNVGRKLHRRSYGSLSKRNIEAIQPRDSKRAPSAQQSVAETRPLSTTTGRTSFESELGSLPTFTPHANLAPLELPNSANLAEKLSEPLAIANETISEPKFPSLQERRHKISLLIEVWLFVSGLYRRAEYIEDAKGAADEAQTLLESLESAIMQVDASSRALSDRGWSDGKSIEELWADIKAERAEIALAEKSPHLALSTFEKALQHTSDHPSATVGLSTILLDIYTGTVAAEPVSAVPIPSLLKVIPRPPPGAASTTSPNASADPPPPKLPEELTPEYLNRIAARDRAYGLLSRLTKSGSGWDCAEAWFALARAYEEGKQESKARECLWWVVELEDTRPVRRWEALGGSGGVL